MGAKCFDVSLVNDIQNRIANTYIYNICLIFVRKKEKQRKGRGDEIFYAQAYRLMRANNMDRTIESKRQ